MIKFAGIVVFSLALSACASAPMPMNTPYSDSLFTASQQKGTAKIVGQAFLKTRGGDVKYGAGNVVKLLPVNDYTSEMRQRVTIRGERVVADPRVDQFARTTVADGTGSFEFTDLPPGAWYISTLITWEVPSQNGLKKTGGAAYATVILSEGETKKVIVTRN